MAFNYQAFYNSSPYGYNAQSGDMASTYQYNAVMPGTTASSSAQVTAFQTPSGAASHYAASGSNSHMSQIGASNAGDSLSAYSQQHVYSPAFPSALTLASAGYDGGNGFGEVQRLHQYGGPSGGSNSNVSGTPYQTALRNAIETSIGSGGSSMPSSRRNDASSGNRFNATSYTTSSYGGGGSGSGYSGGKSSGSGGMSMGMGMNQAGGQGMGMFPRASAPDRWRTKRIEQKAARGGAPAQQFYCETCRVACAGSQTYKEHLEGRQHKKKEAAARELERLEKAKQAKLLTVPTSLSAPPGPTASAPTSTNITTIPTTAAAAVAKPAPAPAASGNKAEYRCTLCEIACTGAEAYAAHMRGQKHVRTLRLHQKMGRPIPPQAVPAVPSATATPSTTVTSTTPVNTGGWVAGGILKVQDGKIQELKTAGAPAATIGQSATTATAATAAAPAAAAANAAAPATAVAAAAAPAKTGESAGSVPIVGSEYIVQRTNEKGQLTGFECKLCECSFTDLNGRDMHLRGKRHRLAYRQKVDPHFRVPDANTKARREETRFAAKKTRDDRVERTRETHWFEQAHVSNAFWSGPGYPTPFGMPPPFVPGGPMGGGYHQPWLGYGLTRDDEYVQKRLKEIEPTSDEAQSLQRIVLTCERALKLVSDAVQARRDDANRVTFEVIAPPNSGADQSNDNDTEMVSRSDQDGAKKDDAAATTTPKTGAPKPPVDSNPNRVLKGVVRVGALANCLLRRGELSVTLVVLSAEKPTRRLLQLVYDELPRKLQQVLDTDNNEEAYTVNVRLESGEIVVRKSTDPKCDCTIRLTSSLVREEALSASASSTQPATTATSTPAPAALASGDELLDRDRCLESLALLRRAKWFQAKCLPHAPTVACLRLIRDLCARVSTWQPLSEWLTALLVQRCAESAPIPPCAAQPSLLLRRFFELIAGGFLVLAVREPLRFALSDPCEKEPVNVARNELTLQTAEDITASAQHALRLIAYHQMFKVINTDAITEEPRAADAPDPAATDAKEELGAAAPAAEKMETDATTSAPAPATVVKTPAPAAPAPQRPQTTAK